MSENEKIYEVATLMTENKDISGELMDVVRQRLKEKYFDKINSVVQAQYAFAQANPSKEIRLLQVARDFCPPERQTEIDKAIQLLTTVNTYRHIRADLDGKRAAPPLLTAADSSIHNDGIYDIDSACSIKNEAKKTDALSALMMMVFMGKEAL